MRQLTKFFACTLAITAFAACGGSGDDDNGGDDDAPDASTTPQPDADTTPSPDAMTANPGTLGYSCTPDGSNPMGQGTCATGYQCLSLQGGTGAWCSKPCDPMTPTSCDEGFNEAGLGYCFLQIDFDGAGGQDPAAYCGVICNDTGAGVCTDCNDTCPANYLQCTAPLMSGGMTVAEGCQ